MTISTETSAVTYAGNGLTSTFPFTFPIFARTHLVVTHIAADGTESLMTENTNYTLTWVGPGETGTVNRIEIILGVPTPFPLPTGQSIRIERVVPLVQDKDLLNNSRIRMDQIEAGLDYQVQISQQLDRRQTASAHASAHMPGGTGALPWDEIHGRGLASERPVAGPTNANLLWYSTDTGALERSNGTAWQPYGSDSSHGQAQWAEVTASFTAVNGGHYIINASANDIVVTMPSGPGVGWFVEILVVDSSNDISVSGNGSKLMGGDDAMEIERAGDGIYLMFTGALFGWSPKSMLSVSGTDGMMTAADVPFTPSVAITSGNVQDAIEEVDDNSIVNALIFG